MYLMCTRFYIWLPSSPDLFFCIISTGMFGIIFTDKSEIDFNHIPNRELQM